ncbi:hypothetical protein OUZ56_003501 [Daphnia magna]|uniref:Uncharacterized protein n=1 Tax=Daphnia magna TaxID=35525 RepID=A0ABR0A8W4_9CRUS|nr:hypothetical protein OUZ56_003501 [Daphnia magna]
MNQDQSHSRDTTEGNPVNEIVLIDFDEDIALNISAEEYENLFPDSADNEVAGIDNEVAVVDNEEAGAENEEAGAENEETGAMRPKTPTGRESKLSIWKYMTLLPTGRIKCNICKKAFKLKCPAAKLMRWYQINCAACVFNLVIVTDGFKRIPAMTRMLKKCQEIAFFLQFKSAQVSSAQEELRFISENMSHEFTDLCYFEDLDIDISTSSVKKDNVNRWNSKCFMIESILANRAVIRRLLLKYNKIELLLSHEEIYFLKCLLKCLMPFQKYTEILQCDKYPIISLVLPMLELLSQEEDNEEAVEEELDLERGELIFLKSDLLILKDNIKISIEKRLKRAENPIYVLATRYSLEMNEQFYNKSI